jgi:pyrroline-5-carboxylate reductase
MAHTRTLLGIIGGGNMAIILGAIDAKLLVPGEIVVVEPDETKRRGFTAWGVRATASAEEALESLAPPPAGDLGEIALAEGLGAMGGQVLLAVKPQSLDEVGGQIGAAMKRTPRVVISILAGTRIERVMGVLGVACPVVRVMPNTPARLRKSMTALATRGALTRNLPAHAVLAHDLFASIGEVVRINEDLMDAYTALAGSGPAYLFYLAEAMIAAAREVGFDRITADRVVRQTIAGAAALLNDSSEPPEALRAAVTSKGGTTEAATRVLEEGQVREAIIAAIEAGRDRGRELGG